MSDKLQRYQRIHAQLAELLKKCDDEGARMASVVALLHHKMRNFFWTGFYHLREGRLIVGVYQGPIACMELKKDTGVCWAAIHRRVPVVVPDVAQFPGHIACDARSKSEICVPYFNRAGEVTAVLDVDSDVLNTFDESDAQALQEMLALIRDVA